MRLFGLLGLVVALVLVGLLIRQQLASQRPLAPALQAPAAGAEPAPTVREQGRQVQQQYQRAIENALQQPARELPADAR